MISKEYLRECLSYNPETGCFIWNERPESHFSPSSKRTAEQKSRIWNSHYSAKQAGTKDSYGYIQIRISGKSYLAHKLAWLYVNSEWPDQVDHINHTRSDNRIGNLRKVKFHQNMKNKSLHKNNKSGFHGIYPKGNRWKAEIGVEGKTKYLGTFDSIDEAIQARSQAENDLGFHDNHGASQ